MQEFEDTYDAALLPQTMVACRPARDASELNPQALDLQFMARNGEALAVDLPLTDFPRFVEQQAAQQSYGDPQAQVTIEISAAHTQDAAGFEQRYLGLYTSAQAQLHCGRCLKPLVIPLEVDNEFLLVDSEEQAASLDEQHDDIEVIAVKRYLRLTRLVEDELLMAMPLSANHEECDLASPTPLGQNRPNPFAVLAKLKKQD